MKILDLIKELIKFAKGLWSQFDDTIGRINIFNEILLFALIVFLIRTPLVETVLNIFGVFINVLLSYIKTGEIQTSVSTCPIPDVVLIIIIFLMYAVFCYKCMCFVAARKDMNRN